MTEAAEPAAVPTEAPAKVPPWVYRLDVDPPARHDGWRRAIRSLRIGRAAQSRRRRTG
jgi:hypothetical protein